MKKILRNAIFKYLGSSSGIGRQTAIDFAKKGASVVIHGQNEERLNVIVISLFLYNIKYLGCKK